jgi:hypothetical protein
MQLVVYSSGFAEEERQKWRRKGGRTGEGFEI